MTKYKLLLCCLLTGLVLWSFGCDEDTPPEPTPRTGLEILEVPGTLLANIDSVYTIRVRIADEGVHPDYVICLVYPPDPSQRSSFHLYDDGGLAELASHEYAGTNSGDIVPNNGTYTRTVNSHLLTNETAGVFVFSFSFPDVPDRIYVDSVSILAANIEQCIIEDATLLNGMVECFDSIDVSVSLTKTEPDTIDSVWVMLGDDDRVLLTPSEVDTLWTASIQPSTFPCLATGEYSLSYSATTRFGMSCTLEMGTVAFTNDVQRISNLVGLPDTIHRPMPGDTDILVVAIDLEDCNLLGVLGYNGVRFDAKREPYDWPPAHDPDFRLYDDGTLGDTTAGDGTYTVGLVFAHSDSLFDNLYIFRYYSVECAPPYEQTNYIYDTVRVIQDNGAIQFSVSPDYPLGFSVQPPSDIASAGDRR